MRINEDKMRIKLRDEVLQMQEGVEHEIVSK